MLNFLKSPFVVDEKSCHSMAYNFSKFMSNQKDVTCSTKERLLFIDFWKIKEKKIGLFTLSSKSCCKGTN